MFDGALVHQFCSISLGLAPLSVDSKIYSYTWASFKLACLNRASNTATGAKKLTENWVIVTGLEEGVSAVAKEKEYPPGDTLIYFSWHLP